MVWKAFKYYVISIVYTAVFEFFDRESDRADKNFYNRARCRDSNPPKKREKKNPGAGRRALWTFSIVIALKLHLQSEFQRYSGKSRTSIED
jgi:hypothetical protein